MLFLGPPASKPDTTPGRAEHSSRSEFEKELAPIARDKHYDMLGLYNMTVQALSVDGKRSEQKVALALAMMVINWLSKLETS